MKFLRMSEKNKRIPSESKPYSSITNKRCHDVYFCIPINYVILECNKQKIVRVKSSWSARKNVLIEQ